MKSDAADLASVVATRLGGEWTVRRANASSFCETWIARSQQQSIFLKSVALSHAHVLESEADGLSALKATNTIRVPDVVGCWSADQHQLLALEWLEFAPADATFGRRFGNALARLHAAQPAGEGAFGWHRDNMLGGTRQVNAWSRDSGLAGWIEFLSRSRFGALRSLLSNADAPTSLLDSLDQIIASLTEFFRDGHEPRASLIHGDLWSGNWGMLSDGTPVIYDPAVSCADAEAELAMMELFGNFPLGFLSAYRELMPLALGYAWRRELYQLHHLLNHVVLFGGSYVQRASASARSVLASLKK